MSNCIQIYDVIMIPLDIVDVDGLFNLIDAGAQRNEKSVFDGSPESMAYWFLTRDNVRISGDQLVIKLGGGRSTHTWRDFEGTLYLLAGYISGNYYTEVQVSDEYDGFKTRGPFPITLTGRV